MSSGRAFREIVFINIFWSIVQNWGSRSISMLVFMISARLLMPADFGIGAAAYTILSFLVLLSDFGFSDAAVQSSRLDHADLNLPFMTSMGVAFCLAAGILLGRSYIAPAIGIAEPYLTAIALLCPLAVAATIQEAMYRRLLRFRELAFRTIMATLAGGAATIVLAFQGFGAWSLIAQYGVQAIVGGIYLWRTPAWRPGLGIRWQEFTRLGRFGTAMLSLKLVDFIAMRSFELIILNIYGAPSAGLFAVASRLYSLLLQLCQSSISSVSLAVLSKITDDKPRLARAFLRSASLCALVGTPLFVGLAAVSNEVSVIAFGQKWSAAGPVMRPLLLVGGVHCIQFIIGAYLMAMGMPKRLLAIIVVKSALIFLAIYFFPQQQVSSLAQIYALAQFAETPLIFAVILSALALRWSELIKPVLIPVLASVVAFELVDLARTTFEMPVSVYLRCMLLMMVYAAGYAMAVTALARKLIVDTFHFFRKGARSGN